MTAFHGEFFEIEGHRPNCHPEAFVAPGARLIGRVVLAAHSSVWFNAVLRGDAASIELGEYSNIQDLTTVHVEAEHERGPGMPELGVKIGRYTTVGHNCVIHSCRIGDDCLIGMNATVMPGAVIGNGAIVAAGAIVLENTEVPPFSLLAGNPGKIRKTYGPGIIPNVIRVAAESYVERTRIYRQSLRPATGGGGGPAAEGPE